MKNISKLFLFGALLLVLLTAACGAEEGASPTLSGTTLPGLDETATPPLDTTMTASTETAETPTAGLETPTLSVTTTSAVGTSVVGTAITGTAASPGIPVTGLDVVLVECQFCVDTLAHALLVLPDTATFEVISPTSTTTTTTTLSPTVSCSTIEVNNGKQIVLCSGPEMTPITLNICTDLNTCTTFPVDLLACPLVQATALPNNTPSSPGTGNATATPGIGVSTATPGATVTPTP